MERDYRQELDQLKEQMEALRQEMATQVERLREEAQRVEIGRASCRERV